MNAGMIALALLACQGERYMPQRPEVMEPYVRVSGGDWLSKGFTFDAVRVDGRREIDGQDAAVAGIEAGFDVDGKYFSFVGLETALSTDVTIRTLSVGAGVSIDPGRISASLPSIRIAPYAAVTYGTFDVDQPSFGGFRPGPGVRAGVEGVLPLTGGTRIGIYAEGRYVRFDYKEDVVEGDEFAGGLGLTLGVSAVVRF